MWYLFLSLPGAPPTVTTIIFLCRDSPEDDGTPVCFSDVFSIIERLKTISCLCVCVCVQVCGSEPVLIIAALPDGMAHLFNWLWHHARLPWLTISLTDGWWCNRIYDQTVKLVWILSQVKEFFSSLYTYNVQSVRITGRQRRAVLQGYCKVILYNYSMTMCETGRETNEGLREALNGADVMKIVEASTAGSDLRSGVSWESYTTCRERDNVVMLS